MVKRLVALAACVIFCVTGLSGCNQTKISTDYETAYDFSTLKTFAVLPVDKKVFDNPMVSALDIKRIGELLPKELAKRYTQVETAEPDFHVRYFLVVEEKMRVESYNATFGYFRNPLGYRYGISTPDVQNTYFQQGSIIIDILDVASQEVIWRGVTEGKVVKTDTPQQRNARLALQLEKLFLTFPPEKK